MLDDSIARADVGVYIILLSKCAVRVELDHVWIVIGRFRTLSRSEHSILGSLRFQVLHTSVCRPTERGTENILLAALYY